MYMWVSRNAGEGSMYPCPNVDCSYGGHHGCAENFLKAKLGPPDYERVYWCECYLCHGTHIAKHYFVSPRDGQGETAGDILCNRCNEGNCPRVGG